jgi:hypothetical protein
MSFLSKIFKKKTNARADFRDSVDKNEIDRNEIDSYFEYGIKSQELWRAGKESEALEYANKQIAWYRDNSKRNMLQLALAGNLPRAILGVDILIRSLKMDNKYDEAIAIINEFRKITDEYSIYNDDLIRRINKKRK